MSVLLLEDPRPSLNDWWIGSNPQDLDMEKFLKKDIILTENSSFLLLLSRDGRFGFYWSGGIGQE